MRRELKQAWANDIRNGEWAACTGNLHEVIISENGDVQEKFCALGRLMVVAGIKPDPVDKKPEPGSITYHRYGGLRAFPGATIARRLVDDPEDRPRYFATDEFMYKVAFHFDQTKDLGSTADMIEAWEPKP